MRPHRRRQKRALQVRADDLAAQLERQEAAHAEALRVLQEAHQRALEQAQQEARQQRSHLVGGAPAAVHVHATACTCSSRA